VNLKGMECTDVDWIHMAQGRHQRPALVNTVMNRRVTIGAFTATKNHKILLGP
jgi:hypothetical protein